MMNESVHGPESLCRNFPHPHDVEVVRENLLETLIRLMNADTRLICIEGQEGIGKSTFMAQLARKISPTSIALFLPTNCPSTISGDYLLTTCAEQIYWILTRKLMKADSADISDVRKLWMKLQKMARSNGTYYSFIVDGLEDMSEEHKSSTIDILREALPIDLVEFRIVLSGNMESFRSFSFAPERSRSFPLSSFSFEETNQFLLRHNLEEPRLREIHRYCSGIPAHLAVADRWLNSGKTIEEFYSADLDELPSFVKCDWDLAMLGDPLQERLLALVAFGTRHYKLAEISKILDSPLETIQTIVDNLPFLRVSDDSLVSFTSEAHRKLACQSLASLEDEVYSSVIQMLLADPDAYDTLADLPDYLSKANRHEDLVGLLSPDYFSKLVESDRSVYPAFNRTKMGLKTAQVSGDNAAVVRFAVQQSVILEIQHETVLKPEIEALMAFEEYEQAVSLAQSAFLKEDRLRCLALIARLRANSGEKEDAALMSLIRALHSQLDLSSLTDNIDDLAADLLVIDSDLAISLIRSKTGEDSQSLDLRLAKLSLEALRNESNLDSASRLLERTREKITDPAAGKFFEQISLFFGNFQPHEIVAKISQLEPSSRLLILRKWCVANSKEPEAIEVVEQAIELFLSAGSQHVVTIEDLKEIATPICSATDGEKIKRLVNRLDALHSSVITSGSTSDSVELTLILARAEAQFSAGLATKRVADLRSRISKLPDLATRIECLAWLHVNLRNTASNTALSEDEVLRSEVHNELVRDANALLDSTAEHYRLLKGTIRALATGDIETCLEIVAKINVESRRNQALLDLITRATMRQTGPISLEQLLKLIRMIEGDIERDAAIHRLVTFLSSKSRRVDGENQTHFVQLLGMVHGIRDSRVRALTCASALNAIRFQTIDGSLATLEDDLKTELRESWLAIDAAWVRIETGFRISSELATTDKVLGRIFLNDSRKVRAENPLFSERAIDAYVGCIKLAIRAYGGFLKTKCHLPGDLKEIERLIARIPCNGLQTELWVTLAAQLLRADLREEARPIIRNKIKPLINQISERDSEYRSNILVAAAPVLWFDHPRSAMQQIDQLGRIERERAVGEICEFLLTGVCCGEPYSDPLKHPRQLEWEEIDDIVTLTSELSSDYAIYSLVKSLSRLAATDGSSRITKEQRASFVEKALALSQSKLPDKRNINHNGYLIALTAIVHRASRTHQQHMTSLYNQAIQINNKSDRAFVLVILASILGESDARRTATWIAEARRLVEALPSEMEKFYRHIDCASLVYEFQAGSGKEFLTDAFSLLKGSSLKWDKDEGLGRLIDVAHQIDPAFAKALVTKLDDDPKRKSVRRRISQQVEQLELKKKMMSGKFEKPTGVVNSKALSKAAWESLGVLNSNRCDPISSEEILKYLLLASSDSIRQSYPIFCWSLQNAVQRFERDRNARSIFQAPFQAFVLSGELLNRTLQRRFNMVSAFSDIDSITPTDGSDHGLIHDSDQAREYIENWLATTTDKRVIICDPYFTPSGLHWIRTIRAKIPSCDVTILTGARAQRDVRKPWSDTYRAYWRTQVSEQDPPPCEIVIVGLKSSGKCPIHDRWWFVGECGIRFGASTNSFGKSVSEISVLNDEQMQSNRQTVLRFLNRDCRVFNKEPVEFESFSL